MTWTAPQITRIDEPRLGDERTMLEAGLDYQRQTLLLKCAGLTAEQLKLRSVEPSSLSLLGLVRHLAAVERWWFRCNFAGQELDDLYYSEDNPDGEFDDVDSADAEADYAGYLREARLCDEAVAGLPLDHQVSRARGGTFSLRWIYLHMIEEYARHNGHADLLREAIDGETGE